MAVIRQMNDKIELQPPQPCSQSNYNGDEESQLLHQQQRHKRSPASTSAVGGLPIERLWETEGLSAMTKAFNQKKCKLKQEIKVQEKDNCASTCGHSSFMRHDGHFAPTRPKLKHSQKESDQAGETKVANPRYLCCRDNSVADGISCNRIIDERVTILRRQRWCETSITRASRVFWFVIQSLRQLNPWELQLDGFAKVLEFCSFKCCILHSNPAWPQLLFILNNVYFSSYKKQMSPSCK